MKMLTFACRNAKEILRDPLNLGFGLGFPAILLLLLSAIQANIPVPLFEISHLTPGITVFGLSFLTLFSATLIAKDRGTSFFMRLFTTPMTAADFILGYTMPLLPIVLAQGAFCYLIAFLLGLTPHWNVVYALLSLLPVAVVFIAMGLLFGSLLTDKQVGGICGALLTNLCAWLSGTWFDLDLVGGMFRRIANVFPFVHAVDMERAILCGAFGEIFPHLWWVLGYAAAFTAVAVIVFLRRMRQK